MSAFAKISEMLKKYRESQIIFTAFETGMLSELSAGTTSGRLFKRCGISERGGIPLLRSLQAMGMVESRNEVYRLKKEWVPLFNPDSTENISGQIIHEQHLSRRWAKLTESVRSGQPVKKQNGRKNKTKANRFINAMANIGSRSAIEFSEIVEFAGNEKLLDLGGGPGMYLKILAQKYPEMRLVLFEQKESVKAARENLREIKNSDRINFISGDLFADKYGKDYDVVLISNVLHIYGPKQVEKILSKCHKCLKNNGQILVKDFWYGEEFSGPEFSAVFALHMLLSTENGTIYSEGEMIQMMKKAGFEITTSIAMGEHSKIIEGKK